MSDIKTNDTKYHEGKEFKDVNFIEKVLRNGEFQDCRFINCDFTKSDLRSNIFHDCTFERCNFSMVQVEGVGFQSVRFIDCKVLGVDFSLSSKFGLSLSFENCSLDYSVFFRLKLQKTKFIGCSLKEVDFTESDLTAAEFTGSDLTGATFYNTILEKTDFRTAKNFSIDPEQNRMKKAKFSSYQLGNLLQKYQLDIE